MRYFGVFNQQLFSIDKMLKSKSSFEELKHAAGGIGRYREV